MELPKILIVDDRQYDRILYQEFLGDSNYTFDELDNGENILKKLKEFAPDIILLDWQMPRVGGLDTLKIVKKNQAFKNIPIIIITGLEDEKVLEEAFDYGSIDFLNKPVTQIELNSRVLNALKLFNAINTNLQQAEELKSLNSIIKDQNIELEKSLDIKSQQLNDNKAEFETSISKKNRKVMSMEIDATKLINDMNSIKGATKECYDLLQKENPGSIVLKKLKSLQREIESLEINDDSWSDFKEAFENIDPKFYEKLVSINSKLTPLDLKHCGYIKLNLDNYEVSKILNVELKSLQMTRYRLKKKLSVGEEMNLREFILQL